MRLNCDPRVLEAESRLVRSLQSTIELTLPRSGMMANDDGSDVFLLTLRPPCVSNSLAHYFVTMLREHLTTDHPFIIQPEAWALIFPETLPNLGSTLLILRCTQRRSTFVGSRGNSYFGYFQC